MWRSRRADDLPPAASPTFDGDPAPPSPPARSASAPAPTASVRTATAANPLFLPSNPEGEPDVVEQGVEVGPDAALPHPLLDLLHASELDPGLAAGLVRVHARLDLLPGQHFQVASEFLGRVTVQLFLAKERPEGCYESSTVRACFLLR